MMTVTDRAHRSGSCDGVVNANPGFSDDSLEHLSAEEKACLVFLEETIESLDNEDDSGLSNDEPDQLPSPGNVATKMADLSASMTKSKLSDSLKHASAKPLRENVDTTYVQRYMVPTPLVVASSAGSVGTSVPSAKPRIPPDRDFSSKTQDTASSNKTSFQDSQKHVSGSVNNVINVGPSSTKHKDYAGTSEAPLSRGPLSYDALVHLRRSASTKKTPLCPTVDHTIDFDKQPPLTMEGPNHDSVLKTPIGVSKSKPSPPVVAPKPKRIPPNISLKAYQEPSKTPDCSNVVAHVADPQVVRVEALQKLGLLEDEDTEKAAVAPLSPSKSLSLEQTCNRLGRRPVYANPTRSPSFSDSQVLREPNNKSLQSTASFHHYSRCEQMSVKCLAQPNGLKAARLQRSSTQDRQRNDRKPPEAQHSRVAEPATDASEALFVPQKPSNSVGYSVMMVPGMGADRKEALRKLGLLKE
ncbi:specifically androgen-regulated gene protein isoform X2 [Thalassophryne amazonica]|uniref:specifically androgen-regulated gene protein isoform X2 n=1 Tax=Thalassophryne amazonica TaxID=390379 RepID=UPI001472457C|nr:specifically androgen-regulated gene protein isoform X2 [Thalassophryne amazonica]